MLLSGLLRKVEARIDSGNVGFGSSPTAHHSRNRCNKRVLCTRIMSVSNSKKLLLIEPLYSLLVSLVLLPKLTIA